MIIHFIKVVNCVHLLLLLHALEQDIFGYFGVPHFQLGRESFSFFFCAVCKEKLGKVVVWLGFKVELDNVLEERTKATW